MAKPPHLSASQINTYLTCPLQHFWRYKQHLKIPPKSALTLSKSLHFGIEGNYRQKLDTHEDLPLKKVLGTFSADFDTRKHETLWDKDEKPGSIKDEGIALLTGYHSQVAHFIQPTNVEHEFEVTFENFDIPLIGRMDLVANHIIIDHKCSAKAPSVMQTEIATSFQFTAYALGYRHVFGEIEKAIGVDVMFRSKKKKPAKIQRKAISKPPNIQNFTTQRSDHDIARFLKMMAYVAKAIEDEIYYPRKPGWECTPDYCGYYEICQKEW